MADQLYQSAYQTTPPQTGNSGDPGRIPELARHLVCRAIREVRVRLQDRYPQSYPVTGHEDRDVLWQAKCNALRRALEHHRLTQLDARRVLSLLAGRGERGCELDRLQPLTGLSAGDLERVVLLMGLHNLIEVQKRTSHYRSAPVLWACITGLGRRYASEFAVPADTTTKGRAKHPHGLSGDPGTARSGDAEPPYEKDGLIYRALDTPRPVSRASVPALSAATGLPEATVLACLTVLSRAGLVDVEERVDHRGRLRWATITGAGKEELDCLYREEPLLQHPIPKRKTTG